MYLWLLEHINIHVHVQTYMHVPVIGEVVADAPSSFSGVGPGTLRHKWTGGCGRLRGRSCGGWGCSCAAFVKVSLCRGGNLVECVGEAAV